MIVPALNNAVKSLLTRAGAENPAGDTIEIRFGEKEVKVEVAAIMDTTKKENAADMYRYV